MNRFQLAHSAANRADFLIVCSSGICARLIGGTRKCGDRSDILKIIDFTSYCDVFRLSERRLQVERPKQAQRLVEALRLLS